MKGDCQQWWDSRVQPKRERKEGIAGVDIGRKALLRYDGTYFRKGIEEAKNIQESRNQRIQKSKNPEIQESKNPTIQKSNNPEIQLSLIFWNLGEFRQAFWQITDKNILDESY